MHVILNALVKGPLWWFLSFDTSRRLPAQREACEPPAWAGCGGMLFVMEPHPGASGGEKVSLQSTGKAVTLGGLQDWSGELKPILHLCRALHPLGFSLVLPEHAAISFPGACQ